jgi:lipoprotein LprG
MTRRGGLFVVLAALLFALVAGCQGDDTPAAGSTGDAAGMPSGAALLKTSSTSMAAVTSVHFTLAVHGQLSSVPVQDADGDLNSSGQAKGNAKLTEMGQLVQVDFVLTGGELYLKGPTGGYQKLSASLATSLFDPSAILDPKRGVAKVLAGVQNPRTVDRESVQGTDTYKVTGTVGQDVVSSLVPGIGSDVTGTFWLGTDPKALPVKAEFAVPGKNGTAGATVDVTFTDINKPVSVSAPA